LHTPLLSTFIERGSTVFAQAGDSASQNGQNTKDPEVHKGQEPLLLNNREEHRRGHVLRGDLYSLKDESLLQRKAGIL
jgi:hypothetical protein